MCAGPASYRAIGSAMKSSSADADWATGKLNMVPINLGVPVTLNYMPDFEALFCPSGRGMPSFSHKALSCPHRLDELKRLGGTDGRALTHGDYSWCSSWGRNASGDAPAAWYRSVRGQYHYRGAMAGSSNYPMYYAVTIPGTRPLVTTQQGSPAFRTPKHLKGRALASDTFSKDYDTCWTGSQHASDGVEGVHDMGAGLYHHKDGYNVLYGDYHTAWWGDPGHIVTSWPVFGDDRSWAYRIGANHTTGTYQSLNYHYTFYENQEVSAGFIVWHWFDEAAGIDVGTADIGTWP